jgi:hypothetical protein
MVRQWLRDAIESSQAGNSAGRRHVGCMRARERWIGRGQRTIDKSFRPRSRVPKLRHPLFQ